MLISAVIIFLVLQEDFWWDFLKIHPQVPFCQSLYCSTTSSSIRSLDLGKCKNDLPLNLLGKRESDFIDSRWPLMFLFPEVVLFHRSDCWVSVLCLPFYLSNLLSAVFTICFFPAVFRIFQHLFYSWYKVWFLCCELSLGQIAIDRIHFMGKVLCLLSREPGPRWPTK